MVKAAAAVLLGFDILALAVIGVDVRALVPSEQARRAGAEWLALMGSNLSAMVAQVAVR